MIQEENFCIPEMVSAILLGTAILNCYPVSHIDSVIPQLRDVEDIKFYYSEQFMS